MFLLLDGKPFPSRGAGEPRPFSDPTLLLLPLPHAAQLVVVALEIDVPAHHTALLIVPCIAPTALHHGPAVADFARATAACFPDSALPPPALTQHEPSRDEVEHELDLPVPPTASVVRDDRAHHHHTPSDVYGRATLATGAAQLEAAKVPASVAAELLRVYVGAAWGFVVAEAPAGRSTIAVAVACAAPRAGFLFAPTRTGFRYAAEVTSRVDGTVADGAQFVAWNLHLISAGTARRGDWAGGGKDPASTLDDMRHRFASGTYKVIVPSKCDWEEVRSSASALPEVRQMYAPLLGAPAGSSTGTACMASGGDAHHHHHNGRLLRHHHHHHHAGQLSSDSSDSGSGGGAKPLPMHGRTSLPTEHIAGGRGFLAAEATSGGHAPHAHHAHHAHWHPSSSGGSGGCAASEQPSAATPTPTHAMGGLSSPLAPVRRGVSFKGGSATIPIAGGGRSAGGGSETLPAFSSPPAATPDASGHMMLSGGGGGSSGDGGGESAGDVTLTDVAASAAATPTPAVAGIIPGVGCLDVLRMKKVALGPDVDLLLMLDMGHGETVMDD